MQRRALWLAAVVVCAPRLADGATYLVGPGRSYPDLQAVAERLEPGDRVEVDGGVTYPGGAAFRAPGAKDAKISIVGVRAGGRRPVLQGGVSTLEAGASHYVFEGLELQGGSSRCFFHHADDITVRDTVIHDCPRHGVLGADDDAGSLTLAYVEVYRAGHGEGAHPIYVTTDEEAYPQAVFHMEHCYVHDALGGNDVKSRAGRNEIYSNWLDGALYHELELIGPDGAGRKLRREDSDVVGNVIRKRGSGSAIRVGGDGTGESNGRYRFVNNTIEIAREARVAFRLFNGLESIVMHNNVIVRAGGGPVRVLLEEDVRWATGRRRIAGTNNWIPTGSTGVPSSWQSTLAGRAPGFVSEQEPRPGPGSPLIGAGAVAPVEPPGFELATPLPTPREEPPPGALERVGTATLRLGAAVDIGALQHHPTASSSAPPAPCSRSGCGCRGAARSSGPAPAAAWLCARLARRRKACQDRRRAA